MAHECPQLPSAAQSQLAPLAADGRDGRAPSRATDVQRRLVDRSSPLSSTEGSLNPVLEEILTTRLCPLPEGQPVNLQGNVSRDSGRVLAEAVFQCRPRLACEIGLACGVSTLFILEALNRSGGGRLIGMDPAQHDATWRGAGLHNVRRAGFAESYEFHEAPSQAVLPKLASTGTRIQFAFIDGWHTFDHTLVDFFYVDLMLDVGGIVVIDDIGYPGIRKLLHFILTNRAYSVVAREAGPGPNARTRAKRTLQSALRPLVRDNFTPNAAARQLERQVDGTQLVALRKDAEDRRSFDHFVAF